MLAIARAHGRGFDDVGDEIADQPFDEASMEDLRAAAGRGSRIGADYARSRPSVIEG
jgi:hypothetical protein